MTGTGAWSEKEGTAREFRPASQRFRSPDLMFYIVDVTAVTTPDVGPGCTYPDEGSIPIAATVSAEAFNRMVGWRVAYWHWVVAGGRRPVSGDAATLDEAKAAAEQALRTELGKKKKVIESVFGG
jgi:hypothetical protein